jgi:N-6 DNA Methylase
MPPARGRLTERSFYPALLSAIQEHGGAGVQEVSFNGEPDIVFTLLGREWILGVKIGQTAATLASAFVQFARHKRDSGLDTGIMLFLPDSMRGVPRTEEAIISALNSRPVLALIDAGPLQKQYGDRPFAQILGTLQRELAPLLARGAESHFPLPTVIAMLQAQVQDLMGQLHEEEVLSVVTNRDLLSDLGSLRPTQAAEVTRFLAAYIVLSQILFLRLLSAAHPDLAPDERPVSKRALRRSFRRVLHINYRPIYELDVLDALPDDYVETTFDLIWALQIEKVRYEIPGRIFHELMPAAIRKLLAAFYTRPQAAELLARLAIQTADDTVFDPACGSGTILVATYRAKEARYRAEGRIGSPHKLFCEEQIFGADIMPFAVHLTSANLSAMDVARTLNRTQIIHGDSLGLIPGRAYTFSVQDYSRGLQGSLLPPVSRQAQTTAGEMYDVPLDKVNVVAMNPPFTKVERRIRDFVNMASFEDLTGGEVGLWGHFIFLADEFLHDDGLCAAVIPINLFRGRESQRVRDFLFTSWTPLYILKPTFNYGFSEWSEYRDTILIARKRPPEDRQEVKFGLVKRPLTDLQEDNIDWLVKQIRGRRSYRSPSLDIDSHRVSEVRKHFVNMMWFFGVGDMAHRDTLTSFVSRFNLDVYPERYFREGYRPVPAGVSSFVFMTRGSQSVRADEAFLTFDHVQAGEIQAQSPLGVRFRIEREAVVPSMRTGIGLQKMDITGEHDFLAVASYRDVQAVRQAAGFTRMLPWQEFWESNARVAEAISSYLVVVHRINPYSPNTHHVAFSSRRPVSASNVFNIVMEPDREVANAVCTVLNSSLFWAYFFLLKEESTGRYINIRFYDLYEMPLYPREDQVEALHDVYDSYATETFPSLREQFDARFDDRYNEFWERQTHPDIRRLWTVLEAPLEPAEVRLAYDIDVARALGVRVTKAELLRLYEVFVKEMILTRHLTRD